MKESKKFFENNRLNRGSTKYFNAKQTDIGIIRKKFKHVLPPIDMMEEYEELSPGTMEKLIEMARKEQDHRHALDFKTIESNNKNTRLGRIFAIIFIAIVSATTLGLTILDGFLSGFAFASLAFFLVALISYKYSTTSNYKGFSSHQRSNHRPGGFQNRNRFNRNNNGRSFTQRDSSRVDSASNSS